MENTAYSLDDFPSTAHYFQSLAFSQSSSSLLLVIFSIVAPAQAWGRVGLKNKKGKPEFVYMTSSATLGKEKNK